MIEVEDLRVELDGQPILKGVALAAERGEVLGLLGPSGSGKSTLVRAILGLVPSSGRIVVDGRSLEGVPPEERNAAVVFQNLALWPHLTVGQNLAFGLEVRGVDPSDRRARIQDALEAVGLAGFESRRPDSLSGGEAQRVAVARAIVLDPNVLLLDEPFSGLDVQLEASMLDLLERLVADRRQTTLFVTHSPAQAERLCTRLLVLEEGRVTASGPLSELREDPATPFVEALTRAYGRM